MSFRSIAAFIVLATFATYWPTLGGTFIYDDVYLLQQDPRLAAPGGARKMWTQSYNGGLDNLYRPLTSLTYWLQFQLHRDTAWPYHAWNLIAHAVAAVLCGRLAWQLMERFDPARRGTVALLSGLIAAVHPAGVEVAAGLVGRAESMQACAMLAALLFAIRLDRAWHVAAVAVLTLVAIGFKEQALVMPVLLATLFWAIGRSDDLASIRERRRLAFAVTALVVAAIVIVRQQFLRFDWPRDAFDWTINPIIRAKGVDRWTLPLELLGRYATLLTWPRDLSIDHGFAVTLTSTRWNSVFPWLGFAAAAVWIVWLISAVRSRNRIAALLLLATAITTGLALNVVVIGTIFGERLLYLPLLFAAPLLAISLTRRRVTVALLSVAIAALAARSFVYAREWNARLAFYTQSFERSPTSIRLAILLAHEQFREGELDDAERTLKTALTVAPRYGELFARLAQIAAERRDFAGARRLIGQAMDVEPSMKIAMWGQAIEERIALLAKQSATRPTNVE